MVPLPGGFGLREDNNRLCRGRHERTNFRGEHYVECYVVKDGVVVASDRIQVPITPE